MIPTLADVIQIGKKHGFVVHWKHDDTTFMVKPCYACVDNHCVLEIVDDDKVCFPTYIMQDADTLQFIPTMDMFVSLANVSVQWLVDRYNELDADMNRIMQKYDQDSQTSALTDIRTSRQTLETVFNDNIFDK